MTTPLPNSKFSKLRNLSVALAVIGLVIGVEYFFRHYVLFWMPIFGTLLVNDMVSLFLGYLLLSVSIGLFMHVDWKKELTGIGQALREGLTGWNFTFWVLGLVLSVWALSMVDRQLWGNIKLPMIVSSYRNPTVWLANFAPILKVVSLIVVNGLFVPIAEEYLWRGVVQVCLIRVPAYVYCYWHDSSSFFAKACISRCIPGTVSCVDCLWGNLRDCRSASQLAAFGSLAYGRQHDSHGHGINFGSELKVSGAPKTSRHILGQVTHCAPHTGFKNRKTARPL